MDSTPTNNLKHFLTNKIICDEDDTEVRTRVETVAIRPRRSALTVRVLRGPVVARFRHRIFKNQFVTFGVLVEMCK